MDDRSILLFLRSLPLFTNLNDTQLTAICRQLVTIQYNEEQNIFIKGQKVCDLYIVKTGKIKRYTYDHTGQEKVLDILGPGSTFPLAELMNKEKNFLYAKTMEKSTLLTIPFSSFQSIMADYPEVMINTLKLIQHKITNLLGSIV